MKVNKDKRHLLISGSNNNSINVDGSITEKSNCKKFLGVNVDYKLKLNEALDSIFEKSRSKSKCLL